MALFKRTGWNSRKDGFRAGRGSKGKSVVSGGLPTIGSTPITYGSLGSMGKGRRRKKSAFSSGGSGSLGGYNLGGFGLSGGAGFAPSAGFGAKKRRSWPKFAAAVLAVAAVGLAVWAINPLALITGGQPEAEEAPRPQHR